MGDYSQCYAISSVSLAAFSARYLCESPFSPVLLMVELNGEAIVLLHAACHFWVRL